MSIVQSRGTLRLWWQQIPALAPRAARSIDWRPIVASWLGALTLAVLLTRDADSDPFVAMRIATVVLCLGCASVFDDPSSQTVASAPTILAVRRAYRVCIVSVPLVAVWGDAAALVASRTDERLSLTSLSLELATVLAVTLAIAAIAPRLAPDGKAGVAVAPTLLGIVALSNGLPGRWEFLSTQTGVTAAAARHRLVAALAMSLVLLCTACRDPGARGIKRSWMTMNRLWHSQRQRNVTADRRGQGWNES
jgi:hypothetical protein